jgi:hypothetical protein
MGESKKKCIVILTVLDNNFYEREFQSSIVISISIYHIFTYIHRQL